jgi:uncharacterized membrane protein
MYNKKIRQRCLHIFAVIVRSSIYFLWDAKYFSTFVFVFALASKNLRKIKFMHVVYYISRGITVYM